MNFTVGIVSQNLVTTSNFVKFRDSRNFTFFEALRVTGDIWHMLNGSYGAMCQVVGIVKPRFKGWPCVTT